MSIRFINIVKERYPLSRVDDSVLVEQNLPTHGFSTTWILQHSKPERSSCIQSSGNEFYLATNGMRSSFFSRLKYNFFSFVNSFKVFRLAANASFIQVKDIYFSALVALVAARIYRKPFFYWLSFPFPETQLYRARNRTARYPVIYRLRGHLYTFIQYKILFPCAAHIFVQSEQMKRDIAQFGIPESKMTPVPMGVQLGDFPEKADLSLDQPQPDTVAYLGSMNKVRHLDFLLRSFALVLSEKPNAILYMIGGSDDESELELLKREAERLGIESSVIFTGGMPREEALKVVRKTAICVSPFYPTFIFNSTSPTKLVEYLALAKPCVANDHPEQKQVLEESGAGITAPWKEKPFAEAMVRMLKDPEEGKRMGMKGRDYIEQYRDYEVLSRKLADQYKKLLLH